jgi:ATP/maltotriose-dependent transcriptional regulator MalT
MFSRAIREFREVGNPDGIASAMSDLGGVRLVQGDLKQARRLLEDSVPNYAAVEDKEGVALSLNNLGDLARQSGDLSLAETNYQRAKATAEEIENKSAEAYVLMGMGDVCKDRGDIAQARKHYEGSLALRKQTGEKQTLGETQVALASLSVEDGRSQEAEAILQQWKEQFHSEQQADDELAASVGLTLALLAEGRQADARKEIEGSQALAVKSQNLLYRLQYELAFARVLLASDHAELARPRLQQALRQARAHGFRGVELEATLSAAELEKRSGHAAMAREQLASLESAARGKGFVLVARKAAAARVSKPQVSPLRFRGFPVESSGFEDQHAALFTESRTRGASGSAE